MYLVSHDSATVIVTGGMSDILQAKSVAKQFDGLSPKHLTVITDTETCITQTFVFKDAASALRMMQELVI